MFRRSNGFEHGPLTPQESKVIETREATLKYDVGKPLLLAMISAVAAVIVVLSVLLGVRVLGRHAWYVVVVVASFGNCAWVILIGRRYDAKVGLTTLFLGVGLGAIGCAGAAALDVLITHYWTELLTAILPFTFAITFAALVMLPNFLEAVLVSPHLEQALAILIGGHDDKYTAPWWFQLLSVRKEEPPPDTQMVEAEVVLKDGHGRIRQILHHLTPPVDLDKFTGVVRKVIETEGQSYSEQLLCGNSNPLAGGAEGRKELNALRDWLVKYQFADWKSRDAKGRPVKQQSIVFTKRGMEILTEVYNAILSPTPEL
jgi:hypothetical protein